MRDDRTDHARRRRRMVERDLRARGVTDAGVLTAMAEVPREEFVRPGLARSAYEDRPLPIERGQTISQPYIVATMAEAAEARPGERVLEIGTGSGYGAAVLATVGASVWTVERHQRLADDAGARLARLGYDTVRVRCGDGTLGWSEEAPFDAVIVTAAGPSVPQPLLDQLADGGRLVMPVGSETGPQSLVRVRRDGDELSTEDLGDVRFVPLVGVEGWPRG
jgi:protein-L-isoaspartate(D-aspartate) O-methyltransferase